MKDIQLKEDYTDYYSVLSQEESEQFLNQIINTSDSNLIPVISALKTGLGSKIKLVKCTSSTFSIMVKKLISLPFRFISIIPYFKDVIDRLYEEEDATRILGVYMPRQNFIMVVTNFDHESFKYARHQVKSDVFLLTILHEMCHYFAANYPSETSKLFGNKLMKFYFHLFKNFAIDMKLPNNKETDEKCMKCAEIFIKHGLAFEANQGSYGRFVDKIIEEMSKVDTSITKAWLFLLGEIFQNYVHSDYAQYINVTIYDAYSDAGFSTNWFSSFFYQELIFPSEVMCILSTTQYKDSAYQTMLKKIFK